MLELAINQTPLVELADFVAVLQYVGNQSGAGKTSLAWALLITANNAGEKAA